MRRAIAALCAFTIVSGLAASALAQTAAPAPIAATAGKASVETTTIGDLLANPSSKAVIQKDYPELIAYPGLDQIKGMTLRGVSAYPEAKLDDTRLKSIQTDLNAAP
ncbi:MAG: hypothetical protein ABI376_00615 [Caulobacteraceae bacterium]